MKTYRCPFGGTFLRASNAKELTAKVTTHNLVAHGPYAVIVCGARGVRAEPTKATRSTTRGYSLSEWPADAIGRRA